MSSGSEGGGAEKISAALTTLHLDKPNDAGATAATGAPPIPATTSNPTARPGHRPQSNKPFESYSKKPGHNFPRNGYAGGGDADGAGNWKGKKSWPQPQRQPPTAPHSSLSNKHFTEKKDKKSFPKKNIGAGYASTGYVTTTAQACSSINGGPAVLLPPVYSAKTTPAKIELSHNSVPQKPNKTLEFLRKYQIKKDEEIKSHNEKQKAARDAVPTGQKGFQRKQVPVAVKQQIESLPVFKDKSEIVEAVRNNQFVIVVGETGSGKSTQIPQFLADAGFGTDGMIGCTQPRRVAAKALAQRVSYECGVELGTLVGYSVRFDKCLSGETVIKFMTDGLLIREMGMDPNLSLYSVIMVDEAHERSLHTDICFGLLKKAAERRPDLRIIVCSATLDEDKFASYFHNAKVFTVEGKSFPVEEIYDPQHEGSYLQAAINTVFNIHTTEAPGDVLVFLTGQDDIEQAWDLIDAGLTARRLSYKDVLVKPCYGALSLEEQNEIFNPTPLNCRKIVLATNIAETSLTIPGIVYVIDVGYYKENEYNPRTGINSLVKKRITQAQATQRKGRAGRTKPGKVYRLYSPATLKGLLPSAVPEILRSDVESVVLQLISMGVHDILTFDFMDAPKPEALMEVLEHLQELSALDEHMALTVVGRRMAEFPLDPPLAKVLIISAHLRCSKDVLTIVSLLSTQHNNLFLRGKKQRVASDAKKALFSHADGDHLSLLQIYQNWEAMGRNVQWCKDNLIQYQYLAEAGEIYVQLSDIMHSNDLKVISSGSGNSTENIRKSFCAGYFRKLAGKSDGHSYITFPRCAGPREYVFLHPSSALFRKQPAHAWIVYHEVMRTTKAYMRGAMVIDVKWIEQFAPIFVKRVKALYPEILNNTQIV